MYPVRLEGEHVVLREFAREDLDAMCAYAADPEVMRWITSGRTFDRAEEHAFLDSQLIEARRPDRTEYHLAMVVRETDRVAGGARIGISSVEHRRGDIGYVVRRDMWGRGYATDAARTLVRFGFETLGLHRIEAHCHPDNGASARVLERIGMSYEGRLRDEFLTPDGWRDSLVYGIVGTDG